MAYQDKKFSFSIDGIKYTDIKGQYESYNDKIYIRVSGTAQMIRQWMKQKYPHIPLSNYYWIKSNSFANGNSITIYLNDAPDNIYNEINAELTDKFEYGSFHYGSNQGGSSIKNKTDEGKSIDYGTKYLHVNNSQPYEANAPAVDWNITQKAAPVKATKQSQTKSATSTYDKGELLVDCAGWEIYKKKFADGRILYNSYKKPNTPINKIDWNTIKGEVYTETEFSYSRFGNFQKWGQIASESYVINLLCNILGKYYINTAATQTNVPTNQYLQNAKLAEIADNLINTNNNLISKLPTKNAFSDQLLYSLNWTNILLDISITEESNLLKGLEWKKAIREDIKNLSDKELIALGVIIKERNGNIINNVLGLCGIYGQNGINLYKERYEKDASSYLYPLWFETLIKNKNTQIPTTTPSTATTGLNESYKSLPPNPKLEFCAINRAEGSYPDGTFPLIFQSFTALTKFIADNIGEMPKKGEGYDKYFVSYKWKFEDSENSDRYEISEDIDNPYKYSNLWAFDSLRMLCYNAWKIDGQSAQSYSFNDEFYTNEIGREGWEINSVQFLSLLSAIIGLYPEDKTKFDYNTFKERFDRFSSVYPKLFNLFSKDIEPQKSKEDIEKAIKGLQYLADKGNDKAIKAIKGLQYLLNK